MWQEIEEVFKNGFLFYVILFLPIIIIVSPVSTVTASHEIPVYRMQHYDLQGVTHGCRSAAISLEARALSTWNTQRHCVVVKLQDLTVDHFRNIRDKAGALIVILPKAFAHFNAEQKNHFLHLESAMLTQHVSIPIYFTYETEELDNIIRDISFSANADDKTKSAAENIIASVAANGYQISINTKTPAMKLDTRISTLQGNLVGSNVDGKIPTIAIVAHYDSFGVASDLSYGADSNGSGVAVLLEIVRLFSNLYSNFKSHAMYNIVFLLTGGGKINYQGSKKWLEDQLDSLDSAIIQEASFIICLDTLSATSNIYMHVSKPPKENSSAALFYRELKIAADKFSSSAVEGIHKKINLADELLAWEHERYSIRRLPAFTLSAIKSHKDMSRSSISDVKDTVNMDNLHQTTQVIVNALASFVYNISSADIFDTSLKVERSFLQAWIDFLTSQARSPQFLATKDNSLLLAFKDTFNKYLRDVKVSFVVPDKRDPEFMFYDVTKATMNIYSVKPAFFDLVVTVAIITYLFGINLLIQQFSNVYGFASDLTTFNKKTS